MVYTNYSRDSDCICCRDNLTNSQENKVLTNKNLRTYMVDIASIYKPSFYSLISIRILITTW